MAAATFDPEATEGGTESDASDASPLRTTGRLQQQMRADPYGRNTHLDEEYVPAPNKAPTLPGPYFSPYAARLRSGVTMTAAAAHRITISSPISTGGFFPAPPLDEPAVLPTVHPLPSASALPTGSGATPPNFLGLCRGDFLEDQAYQTPTDYTMLSDDLFHPYTTGLHTQPIVISSTYTTYCDDDDDDDVYDDEA